MRPATDEQLKEWMRQGLLRAAVLKRETLRQLIDNGATATDLVTGMIATNPRPGDPTAERICEMARAGEFDAFLQELLSIGQN